MSMLTLLTTPVEAFSSGGPPASCGSSNWADCDCRNRTWSEVKVLSWHIHYTTNTSDMVRFSKAFSKEFRHLMDPKQYKCPFGPNYGEVSIDCTGVRPRSVRR